MLSQLLTRENLTILFKALALSLFFTGTGKCFDLLLPKKTWLNALLMVAVSIAMLLWRDGSLSELYDLKPHVAAAAAAQRQHD
jgi:hypothetical protein